MSLDRSPKAKSSLWTIFQNFVWTEMGHTQSLQFYSIFGWAKFAPLKAQNIAKVKTFQKTISSGISQQLTQSQALEFSANYVLLFFVITTHN